MKKTALISGICGQDGAWLAELLMQKGYGILGGVRNMDTITTENLDYLSITKNIQFIPFDIQNHRVVQASLLQYQPDEIYHLASMSRVNTSFDNPYQVTLANSLSVVTILDYIKHHAPKTKFFQAGSSEIFGNPAQTPQTESTTCQPTNPYGCSKLYAHQMVQIYRKTYDLFLCNGILYNHESELRKEGFVTRKISQHIAQYHLGQKEPLTIGNLESKRDWSDAREFVAGMYMAMQHPLADDYIFASGQQTNVRDFITLAFAAIQIKLKWQGQGLQEQAINPKTGDLCVQIDKQYYRPIDSGTLVGDANKARKILNWHPQTQLPKLVKRMVQADIQRLKQVIESSQAHLL